MVINTKNLYYKTEFDTARPFNKENELIYSKICGKEINKDNKRNRNYSEINELEKNNSIKRNIDEEEISRPYKKIGTNTTWKKLKISKKL